MSSSLVTGLLLQFGEIQTYDDTFYLQAVGFCYDFSTDSYDGCYWDVVSSITGSFYEVLDPPRIITYLKLHSENSYNEICAFQVFGYDYCDFTFADSAAQDWYVPVGSTEVIATSLDFTLSTAIGSIGTTDDEFCALGITAGISSSSSYPELSVTASITDGTLIVQTDSSTASSLAGTSYTFTLQLYDGRNSTATLKTSAITVYYTAACVINDLTGILAEETDGAALEG